MASLAECQQALLELAERMASDSGTDPRKKLENRSISCELRDLGAIFVGQFRDGGLYDIRQTQQAKAQIRLSMTSDDLIALIRGELELGHAWINGRLKVHASVFDLLKLRSIL